MSNKKIYKNRLSLPIFDNKGIGNGNGVAYIPNVIRGGSAIPIGNNMFLMRGRSHAQGGIDIGKDLEVEGNEVVQNGKFGTKVFSSVPFLRGVSPAERVLRGENPDTVFAAQETWKRVNKVADDGSRKARKGKYVTNPNVVQSDNTRVAPIFNNPPKSKEIRQGDFLYTPAHLELTENGFKMVPASRRESMIPLRPVYPEFDLFMLPRVAANYAASPILQLERELSKGLKNIKIVNKPLKPKVRTRIGDVEIDNPNLLYHLDRGDGVGAFSNRGAYVEKGRLFPGIAKEGEVPYSWWNLGKPYSTSVKGQPMTRLMTAIKDTPGMLNVKSQNYRIGQWNGKGGFVTPFEYVNPKPVDVSNSTYILNPNYGWKKISNENLRSIFDIKNDIDFYNAANEFANKYGYETFDKSLVGNREALENAVKQMLNRHNTFYRGVVGDNTTKRIAVDTPWKEGEGIWVSPQADYAQLYGQVGKLQRPYTLSDNRMNWFKDADFNYSFADDNVGLINPWQRNPKLYEDIIIDKSVPHELYAKDKLNFIDWVKDIKNAKGSNNVMNYKKFGGRIKGTLGLSLFKPNSFKVRRVPINDFITPTLGEVEEPETPTYVLKDDEKPVGKKVNLNDIGGGRLYNGYAVDNHEGENVNSIGGGRVYAAKPIDEFATDSISFGDIKSPRGFKEQDADYIYDYLSKHSDLTDTAKAAILATAAFESGMNSRAKNKYSTAKGLFQWLDDRYIPTPGLNDEQERIAQLNKIIDDMTPVKGKAKGWTQTKTRNIFDLANEFRTTDDIDRAVEIITRHHIRPSLGEEPRKNKQGVEVDKGYKWEIAERSKVARQFYNRMFNRKNKKEFGGMKLNIFKLGGLSRSKDYGSKDKPYPNVNKNDFAGGGRSYPIPTRADAVDALRLAGLHHRSDVRAKVYAKYPDLRKKAAMGTIDDEDVLEALRTGNVRNATAEERVAEPIRTNYVERNNSSDNFGLGIGTILGGGAALSGLGYVGNKLNNYFSEDAINGRRVAKILKNQENIRQAIEDRPKVLGKRFGKELSRIRTNTPISNESFDLTHRINYEEPIRDINNVPASLERRDARIAAGVKAAKNKIKTDNTNVAKAIKNSAKNFKGVIGTMGKLFPAVAAIDFVRNLFPSKQQEQEADKAWRRYKSPTGHIPEDYQLKFGGRRKALFGKDDEDVLNNTVWHRLSLTNPERYYISTKNGELEFDENYNTPIYDMFRNPATRALVPSNEFSPGKFYEDLGETIPVESITLSDIARSAKPTLPNPSRSWIYNVPDYTGNINGQEVVINPDYIQQVPKSVRQAVLNNTPEIVRGANSTRRGTNSTISVDRAREAFKDFYHRKNQPIHKPNPLVSRYYNYGWSHNSFELSDKSKAAIENAKRVNEELDNLKNIDLSKYFNANGTPKSNPTRRTQPVRVRTERVGNVPEAYREFKRPNLTQLETRGIGLNMPAYTSPFTPTTTSGTRTYDIGVPTTLDTSRLDSILSRYGVSPISSSTGVQPNPTDVEAVRSGNFKAIDNDRYIPIRTTTEDWVGLGANLLGSIGSYLGTRAMLKHYPMPNKPVPAIAQKLKTRVNINPQLDTLREQADKLKTSIDNNTSSSRVSQARKQGVMNNAVASQNQLFGQKENAETQLINQDTMNRQRVGLYNNQLYNNWLYNLFNTRRYVAEGEIGNFNNALSNTNQSIQDLLGRIDNRDANRRDFIFMQAAYPNVNWRNIFANPELARSLGFRFLNS